MSKTSAFKHALPALIVIAAIAAVLALLPAGAQRAFADDATLLQQSADVLADGTSAAIAPAAFCETDGLSAQATTTAKSAKKTTKKKAAFKFKRYRATKAFSVVTAKYSYDKPVIKGSTAAVKKMNKVMKKRYKTSLEHKKVIWQYAENETWDAFANADFYTIYETDVTYNKGGYLSVLYTEQYHAGGPHPYTYLTGDTFSLKTGKKLNVSQVVKGNAKQVKKKIANKLWAKYQNAYYGTTKAEVTQMVLDTKIADFQFHLKGGKVYVDLGEYAYGLPYMAGCITVVLPGNYA